MKRGYVVCPKCNGTGIMTFENGKEARCSFCFSSGEVPKEKTMQTNEEYIQTCNHKELTEILFRMIVHGTVIRPDREYISEWLKEAHI